MKPYQIALIAVLWLTGCDTGSSAIRKGDEVALRKGGAPDGKSWLAADEGALLDMGKPPAEFDKVFDQLVADKRIFLENDGARVIVLDTKFVGTKAAHIRIREGLNPEREAWCPLSNLVPLSKP